MGEGGRRRKRSALKGLKPLYQLGYSAPANKAEPRGWVRSSFLRATYNDKLVFQEQGGRCAHLRDA